MASERDPNAPGAGPPNPFAPPASRPLADVAALFGRAPVKAAQPLPEEAGGTMVGMAAIASPKAPVAPPAEDDVGQTVIGMRRLPAPPSAAPPPAPPRPFGQVAPNFGAYAMPMPAQPAPQTSGTMIGMAAVGHIPTVPVAAAEPPGTMVGMAAVRPSFGAPPPAAQLDSGEAGGTMVGVARVSIPGAFAPPVPAGPPGDAGGGTMVGISRFNINAPPPADPSESGGTMVGVPVAALHGFAAPAPPPRPSGPPPDYEIIAHLGGGTLGQVFHARHKETGGEFALRIIKPEIAAVPGSIDALRDMVAMAQGAEHTHLGQQYVLDESASPTLVVEYVPGRLLSSLMGNKGPAPSAAVIDLGVRLCSALAAAHSVGLAHGRVHSGNVVLETKTGRWVLLDLGHGYAEGALEPSHDLYALGALLYEMATGHSAFESGDVAPDPRTHVPKLPATMSALLMRALAPDPALWFPSAGEMVQALARARGQG